MTQQDTMTEITGLPSGIYELGGHGLAPYTDENHCIVLQFELRNSKIMTADVVDNVTGSPILAIVRDSKIVNNRSAILILLELFQLHENSGYAGVCDISAYTLYH